MNLGMSLEVRQELKQKHAMECTLCGGDLVHRAQRLTGRTRRIRFFGASGLLL